MIVRLVCLFVKGSMILIVRCQFYGLWVCFWVIGCGWLCEFFIGDVDGGRVHDRVLILWVCCFDQQCGAG